MKAITIINQKGGVGKTTTALAIYAGLRLKGYKVLAIDLDPQRNFSYTLGVLSPAASSLEVIKGECTARDAIVQTEQGDLIPASNVLSSVDAYFAENKVYRKEYRLREALKGVQDDYDYIVIDTPPALGNLSVNALTAADIAVIPTQADVFSLQGIGDFVETLRAVKESTNPGLKVAGILLTRYNGRANLSKEVLEMVQQTADQMQTKTFKTNIRECIALKEAQAYQSNIFAYAPKSNASEDYQAVLGELLEDLNNGD